MRFLLDMGISIRVAEWLRNAGHDTIHLSERGLHKLSDQSIIEKASIEKRIILTADMDFGQLLAISNSSSVSIIQFRVTDFKAINIIDKLNLVLELFVKETHHKFIVTVEDNRIRLRTLPINPSSTV